MTPAVNGDTVEADFLARHPPFQDLTSSELSELASAADASTYDAGATIVGADVDDLDAVWMVRSGQVDLVHPDDAAALAPEEPALAPLDTVESGGLFGFSAMLTGSRTQFVARARTEAAVYRLPGPLVRPHFAKPAGLAYLANTIGASFGGAHAVSGVSVVTGSPRDAAEVTVGTLVRSPPVTTPPGTSVRDAVRIMTERGTSYVLIPLPHGRVGIFTDRDLRTRVVGAGASVDVPVENVMSSPAHTVTADRTATGVLMDMLERGLRHMPVRDVRGAVIGVVEDADLLANSTRRSFTLRREIARAATAAELVSAAAAFPDLIVDMFRTGTAVSAASGVISVVVDALVRRAVEIALVTAGTGYVDARDVAWVSLGSVGRREAMPSSDVDSALSWAVTAQDRAQDLRAIAADVHRMLCECGIPADSNGAVASSPRFSRSAPAWTAAAHEWLGDPLEDRGLVMSSLLIDGRVVWGNATLHTAAREYSSMAGQYPEALRLQLREALATRAKVRSLRDVVARRGNTVDLKAHAVSPIVNLARWGGLSVGIASASTPERLRAAAGNGLLTEDDARLLTEVFDVLQRLRFAHQAGQLSEGKAPGDVVVLPNLTPLERSVLVDSIREIAAVQRRVSYIAANSGVSIQ